MNGASFRCVIALSLLLISVQTQAQAIENRLEWFSEAKFNLGPCSNGHLYYLKGNHYAICDRQGNALTPFDYSAVYRICDTLYSVKTASGYQLLGYELLPKHTGYFDTIMHYYENRDYVACLRSNKPFYLNLRTGNLSPYAPPQALVPSMYADEVYNSPDDWTSEVDSYWTSVSYPFVRSSVFTVKKNGKGRRAHYAIYFGKRKLATSEYEPVLFHQLYLLRDFYGYYTLFQNDNPTPLADSLTYPKFMNDELICLQKGFDDSQLFSIYTGDGQVLCRSEKYHPSYYRYTYQNREFCFIVAKQDEQHILYDCQGKVLYRNDANYTFYGPFALVHSQGRFGSNKARYIALLDENPQAFWGQLNGHTMCRYEESSVQIYDDNAWRQFDTLYFYNALAIGISDSLSCMYTLQTGERFRCTNAELRPFYPPTGNLIYIREGKYWRLYDYFADERIGKSPYLAIHADYDSGYHVVLTENGKVALVSKEGKEFFE